MSRSSLVGLGTRRERGCKGSLCYKALRAATTKGDSRKQPQPSLLSQVSKQRRVCAWTSKVVYKQLPSEAQPSPINSPRPSLNLAPLRLSGHRRDEAGTEWHKNVLADGAKTLALAATDKALGPSERNVLSVHHHMHTPEGLDQISSQTKETLHQYLVCINPRYKHANIPSAFAGIALEVPFVAEDTLLHDPKCIFHQLENCCHAWHRTR